jgi:hypothetical protein
MSRLGHSHQMDTSPAVSGCPLSRRKWTSRQTSRQVRFVPIGTYAAQQNRRLFDHLVGTTSAHLRRATRTNLDVARSIRATPSLHDHSGEHVGLQHHQNADEAGQCDRVAEDEAQDRVPSCPNQLVAVEATTIDWASIILPMTPRRIGRAHEDGRDAQLLRGDAP